MENTIELLLGINNNRENISILKDTYKMDNSVLKSESAIEIEFYKQYNFNNSLDSLRKLGYNINSDITLESATEGKKSLLQKIKDLFKQKKVLIENKNIRITDHDIPDSINNTAIANEILYGNYSFITSFINNNKIEPSNIIENYKSYLEKVEKYYNKYLKNSSLFELSNLLNNKSSFLGHKFDEKLELLNNKSLLEVYDFDLNKIKLSDKQSGLTVIEYRYLFLSFDTKSCIYLIKYIKTGDLYITNISYKYTNIKNKLEGVKINLSKEDVIKIITEKSYDDKYLRLPENSEIYEGTNNTEVFFKTIDKVLSKEIKFDKTIISKLNSNNSFDYWDEYDTEEEFKVKDNNLIKKYLYNLCYDNYYDNVEQDHNGNILAYNFYWNIVANIIDLFKNKKLEK